MRPEFTLDNSRGAILAEWSPCWIVVRFKAQSQPEKTENVLAAFQEVIAPSRAVDGVISFDIGRDVANPDSFIAIPKELLLFLARVPSRMPLTG